MNQIPEVPDEVIYYYDRFARIYKAFWYKYTNVSKTGRSMREIAWTHHKRREEIESIIVDIKLNQNPNLLTRYV